MGGEEGRGQGAGGRGQGAGEQRGRGAGEQRGRGAGEQRGRGAEGQRGRGAEGQRGRGAEGQRGMENQKPVQSHRDLEVYQTAFGAAMEIFELSKKFPIEERYSLTDQIRRSSRSVCANLGEAWRKRRYEASFVAKLNDCEAEAAETQIWIEFAAKCKYLELETGRQLYHTYDVILSKLVKMIANPSPWLMLKARKG